MIDEILAQVYNKSKQYLANSLVECATVTTSAALPGGAPYHMPMQLALSTVTCSRSLSTESLCTNRHRRNKCQNSATTRNENADSKEENPTPKWSRFKLGVNPSELTPTEGTTANKH